ncbi:branched-chain amino acid ABC transporter permease [Mesorhizobium australicum]|uniref:Amino acid/amide ABC transporter membrane protein 2, HAAT family n=1 Tax=Mesorhizobium australicum TaxID=536018 RepID=A0A1X7PS72_9HYPH|nr:branched-chain amino acid ABC transporter permease [Mesorhizobium australicum]SMH54741.1 amino acid/amide ABC transporter membrane protein 2, HAAT family [Mesorhizobium australicum]
MANKIVPEAPRAPTILPVLVIVALGIALPFVLTSGFHVRLAMLVWIYAILCMGFNLLYGFSGQISLGQPAFYAIGAYAFAMLQVMAGWGPLMAFAGSLVIVAVLSLLIGLPLLRLRTHYLAMATLAFMLVQNGVANRWIEFTGGQSGVAVPPLEWNGESINRTGIYFVVLALAATVLLVHDFLIRSHLGRAMQAIRDDETAAQALGVRVTRTKLRVLVLSGVMAAIAGICFGITSLRVDPSLSEFHVLVSMLTIVVVGGLGTRFGPILGSVIVVVLPQLLTRFGELETVVYGLFILIFLVFLPHGLSGLLERRDWFGARKSASELEKRPQEIKESVR